MVFPCEKKDALQRLVEPARTLVVTAVEILGPERNGFQKVKIQTPNGTVCQITRDINIRDDIYTAGYRHPAEIGLTIISHEGEILHLPRRGESVNEETIGQLRGFSEETLTSLAKEIKEGRVIQ